MPLSFGFYNSVNGDRAYNAEQMSSLFDGMIHDGIFLEIGNAFGIAQSTGMGVNVLPGRAWFNQTWTENTSEFRLAIDASHVQYGRIDVVVLEIDKSPEIRANSVKVIKGTPSGSPVAPTLTNSGTLHQYPLAHVAVGANVTSILTVNITNKMGTVDCPFVTGVLRNVDTVAIDQEIATLEGLIADMESSITGVAPLTSNVTYYVAKTGSDSNNGLAVGTPFLTIGKALSLIPKQFQNADAVIHIASGTYNEYVNIRGFYGDGNLYIYGSNSPTKPIVNSLNTFGCSLRAIGINNIDPDYINISDSIRVTYDGIKCDNRTVSVVDSTCCYIMNCSFSGADPCIYANRGSTIGVAGNSGSGNGKVLEANYGSTLVKIGAVGITGTTAETVSNGGVIR